MSLYMEQQTGTIAKNGTTSDEIDLKNNCEFVRVELSTMDSCTVSLQGASATGGTFRAIGVSGSNASPTTTGNCFFMFKACGLRFIKVVASASQTTAAVTIYAVGVKL